MGKFDVWCDAQFRRSYKSYPNTIGFQCRRDLHNGRDCAQHSCSDVHSSDVHAILSCVEILWCLGKNCMTIGTDHDITLQIERAIWMVRGDYLATASSMGNCIYFWSWHPRKSSQTDQSDARWCVGWRDKNYRQITIELTVVEIISSLHLTSRLLSAWSRQFRCSARFECLYNSFPHTICFQWRRALSMHQNLSQHLCSERFPSCISSLNYM